ncbi:TPA: hypothetical protein DEG75_02185 [Candidatus Dependentiae bacterium]|nr:hypothetical protein [Candidatus Dependentiae bacterium]
MSENMTVGIGIDSVGISRFRAFNYYSDKQLLRIFSPEELHYCRAHLSKSNERFAVRFAAKEALFKALSLYTQKAPCSFLTLCKISSLTTPPSSPFPQITLQWEQLDIHPCSILVTLTHTQDIATALICLQKIDIIKKLL